MHEIEPETWSKLTERVVGVNTAATMGYDDYFVKKLPFMFVSWKDYRDFLLEKIIEEKDRYIFKKVFSRLDAVYSDMFDISIMHKICVQSLLANDTDLTKISGFEGGKPAVAYRKYKNGKPLDIIRGKVYDSYIKRGNK